MSRVLSALCAPLFLLCLSPAHAAEVSRTDVQGASGMCRAASTAYSAGVRYRPLGLSNLSAEPVFVTCNWQGDDYQMSMRATTEVSIQAFNESGVPVQLACTLVDGQRSGGIIFATYTTKTAAIDPGAGALLKWVPADIVEAPATIKLPALSCSLPPSTTLQFTSRVYNEDVGA